MTHIYLRRPMNRKLNNGAELSFRVNQALRNAGYSQLSRVNAAIDGTGVTLSGTVPTYFHKSLAQEIVFAIPGIKSVNNSLNVG